MRLRPLVAVLALVGISALTACVPPGLACPAIGFVYSAPVVLEVDPDLVGDGTAAACFGDECEAAELALDADGRGRVPQEPPYFPEGTIGINPGDGIRVVITDGAGEVVRDERFEIPYKSTAEPTSCPAPVGFQPVVVS